MRWLLMASILSTASLLAGCQRAGFAVMNGLAPRVEVSTFAYADHARGKFDLYAPREQAPTASPLVVFWYGGAWQNGDRADYRFVGATLAARGVVTAIPDYRLYPEVAFPDFLRDAAAAVARAQQEAPRLGADPRRIVLAGHSAGAYIAAMLALDPRYLSEAGVEPASIAGLVGLSGPYAVAPDTAVLHAIFTAQAAPAQFQVVPHSSAQAPPALLVHGDADTVVGLHHTQALATALGRAGVPVDLRVEPGRRHVDTVIALSRPAAFRIPGLAEAVVSFALTRPAR